MKGSERDKKLLEVLQEVVIGGERTVDFFRTKGWLEAAAELVHIGFIEEVNGCYYAMQKGKDFFRTALDLSSMKDLTITFPAH
jgi:hypothetical protein